MVNMKRPIEKYGWEYQYNRKPTKKVTEYYFENSLGHTIMINTNGDILFLNEEVGFNFEALYAIYETAKQIKEEN